ncbi:sulfurtransferase TusA family protein [Oceanospirillum sediminis]|uniref:Sulfurtransferase TusA family protein n=1 Tax=Oceanospirillum sediminis TaxID=2760088 RepID=A0A839IQ09_9GAMM|nr:sulfurtransferase TusA family protein [Oceanospirillum sediminis]MBB1486569.1 sulfurtransferase TusA family protein [Oceanospirillum sediminis]
MNQHELNARNLLCPIPVIRTQNKIASLENGDHLVVYCTDPGTLHDIPAWCRVHGHTLVSTEENRDEIIIEIEVVKE